MWWRTTWSDAIWSSDLRSLEKLAALAYADHAGPARTAWVTLPRLMERTGMSRDAANRARQGLVSKGWLVLRQEARQQRAAVFELVIPRRSSSTADVRLSSTADVRLAETSSTGDDTSSTPPDTSSTPGVLNPSSYPSSHPSSSSARAIVASALAGPGEDEEDDRLVEQHLDGFLAANNVKAALPWLRACADSGDLRRNFNKYVEQTQESERRDQRVAAESAAKANEVDNLWRQVQEAAGDEDPLELCKREAAAMGRYGAGIRDPQVLNSVLQTLAVEREQREAS